MSSVQAGDTRWRLSAGTGAARVVALAGRGEDMALGSLGRVKPSAEGQGDEQLFECFSGNVKLLVKFFC